jgi:hypothetical protein
MSVLSITMSTMNKVIYVTLVLLSLLGMAKDKAIKTRAMMAMIQIYSSR